MRLREVDIVGFFGLDHAHLQLLDQDSVLTLIVGPNGSGKSSVLRTLQFFAENFPFPNVAKGCTRLSVNDFACWDASRDNAHVRLDFELSTKEQEELLQWRRLGLQLHMKHALTAAARRLKCEGGHDEDAAILRGLVGKLMGSPAVVGHASGDEDSAATEGADTGSAESNDFFQELESRLKRVHADLPRGQNPFGQLCYDLATVPYNPAVVVYAAPRFCRTGVPVDRSRVVGANDETFAALAALERAEFEQVLERVPPSVRECVMQDVDVTHVASAQLTQHLRECYHPLPVHKPPADPAMSPAEREFVLDDDFVFMEHIRPSWHEFQRWRAVWLNATEQKKERKRDYLLGSHGARRHRDEDKTHYDGSASAESRSPCRLGVPCWQLREWRTRRLTDHLLPPLQRHEPFAALRNDVAMFIRSLSFHAFDGNEDLELDQKDKGFVLGCMLRTSMAFVQQSRTASPATHTAPRWPLPGVFDMRAAEQMLKSACVAPPVVAEAGGGVPAVSNAVRSVLGLEVVPVTQNRQLFLQLRRCGSTDGSPLAFGSGGERECVLVLTAVRLSSFPTVFLDEPGHNLHPGAQVRLLHELREGGKAAQANVVVVTHAERLVNRVTIERCFLAVRQPQGCCVELLSTRIPAAIWNDVGKRDQLSMAPYSHLLFADKVLMVEGSTEVRVSLLLQQMLLSDVKRYDVLEAKEPWVLELACAIGLEVVMAIDLDAICLGMKDGSKKSTATLVKFASQKIAQLLTAAQSDIDDTAVRAKLVELKVQAGFSNVFEGCLDDKTRQETYDACLSVRKWVWDASNGHVFVQNRDLEEEFLRVGTAAHKRVLLLYRMQHKGEQLVDLDEAHVDVANLLVYARHLGLRALLEPERYATCPNCGKAASQAAQAAECQPLPSAHMKRLLSSWQSFHESHTSCLMISEPEQAELLRMCAPDTCDRAPDLQQAVEDAIQALKGILKGSKCDEAMFASKFEDVRKYAERLRTQAFSSTETMLLVGERSLYSSRSKLFGWLHNHKGWRSIPFDDLRRLVQLAIDDHRETFVGNQFPGNLCCMIHRFGGGNGDGPAERVLQIPPTAGDCYEAWTSAGLPHRPARQLAEQRLLPGHATTKSRLKQVLQQPRDLQCAQRCIDMLQERWAAWLQQAEVTRTLPHGTLLKHMDALVETGHHPPEADTLICVWLRALATPIHPCRAVRDALMKHLSS